jgi:hypothetical protein
MKLRGLRQIWVALALVPLMAGLALASTPAMFLCRGDLVARATCCCPMVEHGPAIARSTQSTLSVRCCCDLAHHDLAHQMKGPVSSGLAAPRVGVPARVQVSIAVATIDLHVLARTCGIWPGASLQHPPPPTIPILLGKQSFLI